jgi:predicted metalloprotease with PDZ domain
LSGKLYFSYVKHQTALVQKKNFLSVIKSFALTILLSGGFFNMQAAEPFKIILNLNEADSFRMKVTILTPKIDLPKVRFVIPSNVPGCISEMKTGRLFSDIKAFDIDGNEIMVKRTSVNEFDIYPSKKLARIEYYVHDSWHYDDPAIIMRQLGTSFIKDRQFLLNFHAIVGYIEGYEDNAYKLEITHPGKLTGNSSMTLRNGINIDTADVANYLALLDNPIMYSRNKDVGFIVGKTHYHICLYSENDSVKIQDISKVLRSVSEGTDEFCGGLNVKDYYFLLNYTDPAYNKVVSEEEYGAVEHTGSSVYYFSEGGDKYKKLRDIQYTSAHELFHLFEPLNIKTDLTNKLNMRAKMQTENLWLYEGFTEYFSLLMQYQKELISEQEFITEIRNKINLSQYFEPYSLTQQSEKCYLEGNEKNYQNFYFKGAIVAMMLDLRLIKLSKGTMDLKSLMIDLKNTTRINYVIKDEAMIPEMVKFSYPEVQEFFDSYVKGTKKIDYNEFLSTVGWKYEVQKIDTERLFVNATYRYTKASKEYYVTNISLDQMGMREGDILVAINGKTITKENLQYLLEKYSDKNNTKDVVFTVKRGGTQMELTGNPLTITRNQKNIITVEKKLDVEKKSFRKKYSSGGLHKNKDFKE